MLFTKLPENFHPKFEVVSCFCENEGSIFLLKRQFVKPQGGTWGVPAGKIDLHENPLEAIHRELQEETGIDIIDSNIHLFKKVYVKYSDLDFVYYIFYIEFKERPQVKIKVKEHQEYLWISPKEALQMNLIEDLDKCIKLFYSNKKF